MHDSQLVQLIALDATLRIRLDSLARKRIASAGLTPTERIMLDPIPVESLARAVANNTSVFAVIKAALDPVAPDVAPAVDAVADSDLDFIVVSEIPTLGS